MKWRGFGDIQRAETNEEARMSKCRRNVEARMTNSARYNRRPLLGFVIRI
jgi:hypothetical protein